MGWLLSGACTAVRGSIPEHLTILGVVLDTLLGLFDVFSNVFSGNVERCDGEAG